MFKRPHIRTWVILLAGISAQPSFAGAAGDVQAGSLLLQGDAQSFTAQLLTTDVSINVNGLVARVSVMQEFRNDGTEWVEGRYVFPLPDGAAVDQMRLYIGDRFIEGELREKEQARKDYERARDSGRKTSLVEQQRANVFTTSVANVAPGETVIVEIEYLETVRYDDGTFSLRFPMTLTPRFTPNDSHTDAAASVPPQQAAPVYAAEPIVTPMLPVSNGHRVSLQASVNAGVPLQLIASRYHPINVAQANGRYLAALAAGQVAMNHDFELLWRPVPSSSPRAMAFLESINGEPHYLLMVTPPDAGLAATARLPREMIFLIDTSGSMHGVSIEQAKRALLRALDGLQANDRFNVVEFNSFATPLFANSVAADTTSIGRAQSFVRMLQANGGTEMRPALEFALARTSTSAYLRQVIFITDGAVANEEELFGLITEKLGDARLFTVGIGSAPNSWFMRKAAETGRGTFTTISALHEVGEKMDRLFRKLENPQVTNIELQWPGGALTESYPGVVPDLYLGEPVSVSVKASAPFPAGQSLRVAGNALGGAWSADIDLDIDMASPGVAALWARARIADLLDRERRGADADTTRTAVVETALAHHLVSKYTSLVAVDKTPERLAGSPLLSRQVANLRPLGQGAAAITGFPATATNAAQLRLTGSVALLAGLLLLVVSRPLRRATHAPVA